MTFIPYKDLPLPQLQRGKPVKAGWFTRLLSIVAPSLAMKRLRALAIYRASENLFGYEAARPSRLSRIRSHGDNRTADQFNAYAIYTLRSQARELERNYDIAESILTDLIANVVGDGIRSEPMVRRADGSQHDEANALIARMWRQWARTPEVTGSLDWAGCQQILARSWFRDGEVFCQLLPGIVSGLTHGSEILFSVELLEADMVPYEYYDLARNVVQGVQKDRWGKPTAYVVYKEPPISTVLPVPHFQFGVSPRRAIAQEVRTILAERMLHLKLVKRIGQTRGISTFAGVMSRLEDLKDYEQSERIAARIGAAFALQISRAADVGPGASSDVDVQQMDIAPGIMFTNLSPGDEVKSIKNERPDNKLTDFRKSQLKAAAGGVQAKYSSIANDYDGTYSAQRQELVEHAVIYHMVRGQFIAAVVQPVYREFVDMLVNQDLLPLEGIDPGTLYDADHRGQGAHYIDIQKEMGADVTAIEARIKSRGQVIRERTGRDPDEVRAEIAAERRKDEEAGLDAVNQGPGDEPEEDAVDDDDDSDESEGSAEEQD